MTLEAVRERYPDAQTYIFGDSAQLSAALLALVRAGKKRATCLSMAEVAGGEVVPQIGRCDIATTFDGWPALVNRTMELRLVRFCDMTEEMALAEGEDEDLAGWKAGHERYYRRLGIFEPQMELIWERFEVVEDLGAVDRDDQDAAP
ncbi:ASCH domain-containing protein [Gymnodinialimonas phycosphaerae]|uniref:ASCH domain-containing protein n=1 Tax=Gymnodinialimonas phycosphaerae TaxID=2841589 RepID=UPI0031F35F5E